jgi:hypothetical protein
MLLRRLKIGLCNVVLPFRALTGSNSPTRLDQFLGCAATLGLPTVKILRIDGF